MKSFTLLLLIMLSTVPCSADNGQELESRGITIAPATIQGDRVVIDFAEQPALSVIAPNQIIDRAFGDCQDSGVCEVEETKYEKVTKLRLHVSQHSELDGHFYLLSTYGVHKIDPEYLSVDLERHVALPNLREIVVEERKRRAEPKPPEIGCILYTPLPDPDRLPRTDSYAEIVAQLPEELASVKGGFVLRSFEELTIQTYEGRTELTEFVSARSLSDPNKRPLNDDDAAEFIVTANMEFQIAPETQFYRYYEWWSRDEVNGKYAIYDDSPAPFKLAEHRITDELAWMKKVDSSERRGRQ